MGIAMGLLEKYDAALSRSPLQTKLATAACISLLSDGVLHSTSRASDGALCSLRHCAVGVGTSGVLHHWTGALDHLFRRWPAGPHTIAAKTAFDMLFMEPALVAARLSSTSLLQGLGARQIANDLHDLLLSLTLSSWAVWVPTAYLTQAYVPKRYQSLFNNAVNFFYTVYVFYAMRKPESRKAKTERRLSRCAPDFAAVEMLRQESEPDACPHCGLGCYDLDNHLCQGLTPPEMRERLLAGNERYIEGYEQPLCHDKKWRQKMVTRKAMPAVAVVGCADSRCEPAVLMDAIEGEMFVCRVAGNYLDSVVAGSVQYACEHLGTRCVLIFGHTKCGAISAASSFEDPGRDKNEEPLVTLVRSIKVALDDKAKFGKYACKDEADKKLKIVQEKYADDLVTANVIEQMGIMKAVLEETRGVAIIGSVFCIHSGTVEILDEYVHDGKLLSFDTGLPV
eukprot:TRINITY_DN7603_c0_g2_i1.p1 TRINITY_DN7603_c0_g2~~TRINITY_DN7603_c0_g2_i1.p1  ORF type:complete len:452 (+),score=56.37 TRINITY_DN7603_c0_g2_i1:103-1458(+)